MSRSEPMRHLWCAECKKARAPHFTVQAIRPSGDGALCRCIVCGHEYVSYSRAAYRWLARFRKANDDALRERAESIRVSNNVSGTTVP